MEHRQRLDIYTWPDISSLNTTRERYTALYRWFRQYPCMVYDKYWPGYMTCNDKGVYSLADAAILSLEQRYEYANGWTNTELFLRFVDYMLLNLPSYSEC